MWISNIGTNNFEIKWKISCMDFADVEYFHFILSNKSGGNTIIINASDVKNSTMIFKDLKPFQKYQVKMSMEAKSVIGSWSSTVEMKTLAKGNLIIFFLFYFFVDFHEIIPKILRCSS